VTTGPAARIADVHYVACRACGSLREIIDDAHLSGDDCTGTATTLDAYRRTYLDAPVAASAPRGRTP
jgi:hypothetical protein